MGIGAVELRARRERLDGPLRRHHGEVQRSCARKLALEVVEHCDAAESTALERGDIEQVGGVDEGLRDVGDVGDALGGCADRRGQVCDVIEAPCVRGDEHRGAAHARDREDGEAIAAELILHAPDEVESNGSGDGLLGEATGGGGASAEQRGHRLRGPGWV